jgi:hypothetical protein
MCILTWRLGIVWCKCKKKKLCVLILFTLRCTCALATRTTLHMNLLLATAPITAGRVTSLEWSWTCMMVNNSVYHAQVMGVEIPCMHAYAWTTNCGLLSSPLLCSSALLVVMSLVWPCGGNVSGCLVFLPLISATPPLESSSLSLFWFAA